MTAKTRGDVGVVAENLASVARQLEGEDTPVRTWQRIVDLAVNTLDGCEMAAISLVHTAGRIDTPVFTDKLALRVDEIQYETGQGPCLQSIRDHEVVVASDLAAEDRWPQFSRRAAAETGIRSMIGFRLFVREDTLGALNLYSSQVAAFVRRFAARSPPPTQPLRWPARPSTSTARGCRTPWRPAGRSGWHWAS